jgi:hypothetical protein
LLMHLDFDSKGALSVPISLSKNKNNYE